MYVTVTTPIYRDNIIAILQNDGDDGGDGDNDDDYDEDGDYCDDDDGDGDDDSEMLNKLCSERMFQNNNILYRLGNNSINEWTNATRYTF